MLLLVALMAAITSYAGDVGNASGFEDDDGNLVAGSATDWNSFKPVTWTGTAPYRTTTASADGWEFTGLEDAVETTTDTAFAGGVKQDANCAKVKGSKAPNKDDLTRIYLATKTIAGHVYLNLGWVRIPQNSTTASAHVAFEFNKGDVPCAAPSDDRLVNRVQGDMLIVYDFAGGTSDPLIKLSRWLLPGYDPPGDAPLVCEVGGGAPTAAGCWGATINLTEQGFAEGKVTTATVTDELKPGGADPGPVEFGEAGIDLTDADVFSEGQCETFGTAFAVSRSSGNSAQAQMKDQAGPGDFTLANCASVRVHKTGSDGGSQNGAVFTLYEGDDTSGTVVGTCTVSGTTSPNCTSTDFVDMPPGEYTIDETTLPTAGGYTKDSSLPFTFTVAAGETRTLTFTNQAQPGSAAITKVDDAGNGVSGAVFKVYSPAGVSNGAPTGTEAGSCTTNASGTCTISGLTAGDYTIDETPPSGYAKDDTFPKTVTISRGQTTNVSATDPRLFKAIVIVCRQHDSTLYPSSISIDSGSNVTSLSAAQASSAGLSVSALCGLTAGARSGLRAAPHSSNPHSASISIPNTQP